MEEQPMMKQARKLANSLYRSYRKEQKQDCGRLLLQWVHEIFCGSIVTDNLPLFDRTYDLLKEAKHIKEPNKLVYGDIDYGVWIEPCKDKRVIASTCYCACRDDNTHLYIRHDSEVDMCDKFWIYSAWSKETKIRGTKYIEHPSINTHRKAKFSYGYQDCRDDGYICLYDRWQKRVEHAELTWKELYWALWELEGHYSALLEEKQIDCSGVSKKGS